MTRELQGEDGVTWTLAAAYAGLSETSDGEDSPDAPDGERRDVVCTPRGGEQTVRLRLAAGWEDSQSDEELLREIETARRRR